MVFLGMSICSYKFWCGYGANVAQVVLFSQISWRTRRTCGFQRPSGKNKVHVYLRSLVLGVRGPYVISIELSVIPVALSEIYYLFIEDDFPFAVHFLWFYIPSATLRYF